MIAPTQRTFIPTQRMQIVRKHLARGEIEKPAPMLRTPAQQIHVAMIHPHHHTRGGQIIR